MEFIQKNKIVISIVAILAVVGVIGVSIFAGNYNSLANGKNDVDKAWSDVETAYQRRNDLIPSLVAIAEQSSMREETILTDVVNARANSISNNPATGDTTALDNSEQQVSGSLDRLIAISEAYPELKSNQNWVDLQTQIEGTENRINVARRDYNDVAQKYNSKIVTFPSGIFARQFGFEKVDYFKADPGAEKAPKITFDKWNLKNNWKYLPRERVKK